MYAHADADASKILTMVRMTSLQSGDVTALLTVLSHTPVMYDPAAH